VTLCMMLLLSLPFKSVCLTDVARSYFQSVSCQVVSTQRRNTSQRIRRPVSDLVCIYCVFDILSVCASLYVILVYIV